MADEQQEASAGAPTVDPVAWDVAERVAVRIARREPLAESYLYSSLSPDFDEYTAEVEELVARETGLRSLSGPARARVTDRAGWIRANLASFQRLLRPLTDRLADRMGNTKVAPVGRQIAGAEVGALLGWMSTRVLGQYDMLVIENENPDDQDLVYYVGPNVLALEKRYGFPPREFRLWLALHEVTHRAQFTGVPWLRPHFLSLVDRSLAAVDPDPKRLAKAAGQVVEDLRAGRNPIGEGGLISLLASEGQREVLTEIQALMALLEGHGNWVMDRLGEEHVEGQARMSRVLRERRRSSGVAAVVQRLLGIELKLRQYAVGEEFFAHVEREAGREPLVRIWDDPAHLPTLDELREPSRWLERAIA